MALEPHYSQIMPPQARKVAAGSAAMLTFNSTKLHFPRFLASRSALFRSLVQQGQNSSEALVSCAMRSPELPRPAGKLRLRVGSLISPAPQNTTGSSAASFEPAHMRRQTAAYAAGAARWGRQPHMRVRLRCMCGATRRRLCMRAGLICPVCHTEQICSVCPVEHRRATFAYTK